MGSSTQGITAVTGQTSSATAIRLVAQSDRERNQAERVRNGYAGSVPSSTQQQAHCRLKAYQLAGEHARAAEGAEVHQRAVDPHTGHLAKGRGEGSRRQEAGGEGRSGMQTFYS